MDTLGQCPLHAIRVIRKKTWLLLYSLYLQETAQLSPPLVLSCRPEGKGREREKERENVTVELCCVAP